MRLLFGLLISCLLWGLSCKKAAAPAAPAVSVTAPSQLSAAVTAKRPQGGEYFGLYLMGKKVGYVFTDLDFVPGRPDQVRAQTDTVFKAQVGENVSERTVSEKRVYEAVPGGRLLAFRFEQTGDGGDQVLEGTVTTEGMEVLRKRPGMPDEKLSLPRPQETVEDADQIRVALSEKRNVKGFSLYPMDLQTYGLSTTLVGEETHILRGVQVSLQKLVTLSEKEKVPVEYLMNDEGRTVEIRFGPMMKAVAESESVAKSLDKVEVFGLTRVTLPRALPDSTRKIPGQVTLLVSGLPAKFQTSNYRQTFKALRNNEVEVTLRGMSPSGKRLNIPIDAPHVGEYRKSSLVVESDNPEIQALAKKIVGVDSDALTAARKINHWVFENLKKDYGASADRATDVLRRLRGDCTEHSLLAVALMRAVGIPARRIDGLIYNLNSDKIPALYWHEWVEAYVGEWTQMDPTFGQEVADATHFALGEETNAEITLLIGQLKVLAVR